MRTHAGSTKTGAGAQVRRAGGQVGKRARGAAGGRVRRGRGVRCGRGAEYGGRKSAECMRWKNYWSKCQRVCARKCPSRSTDCICNASTWYFVEPHEKVAFWAPVSAPTRWQNDQYFLENTHSHQKRPGRPEGDQGSPEGNQRAGPSAARAARRLPWQGPDPRAARKPRPAPSLGRAGPGRSVGNAFGRTARPPRRAPHGTPPHGAPPTARPPRRAPPGAPRTARSPATRGASASGGRAG